MQASPLRSRARTRRTPDTEGCYSSYVVAADLDGDGHLDLVFASGGGYFLPSTAAPLAVYLNDGKGTFVDIGPSAFGRFEGRVRQVAVADIDGDGDLDVFVPDGYGMCADALFVNDGGHPPHFTDEGRARLGTTSSAGAARFGDVDGDGAMDLVIADWGPDPPLSPGTVRVFLNDGRGYFREKPGAVPAASVGTGPVDVDLFDANGDFVLDALVAHRKGSAELLLGDGSGGFVSEPSFPRPPGGYVYGPDECDVDGDGDLDVWLDNGPGREPERLLINDGRGHFTDETAARIQGNPPFVDDSVVRCADVDGDGAMDLVVGSVGGDRRVLHNDGTGHFTRVPSAFPVQRISTLGLDVADLDGDGRLDVVAAQGEKGPFLRRVYLGTDAVPRDHSPPVVRAIETLSPSRGVVRFAVRDDATSDVGPRLQSAGLEVDGRETPATFVGGDLFRVELPRARGDVTYRACAVDVAGNRGCSAPVHVRATDSGVARRGAELAGVIVVVLAAFAVRQRRAASKGTRARNVAS